MADTDEVKSYLACWFQLGKAVILATPAGTQPIKPQQILALQGLSAEFESCWQQILTQPECCYLENTDETIADLLSSRWLLDPCSRCGLPVPVIQAGPQDLGPCPCSSLSNWPNNQTIPPRWLQGTQAEQFDHIQQRLSRSAPGGNRPHVSP